MDYTSGGGYITVGGVRIFQDQNLASGISGSDVDATWLNGVQASILNPVIAAGLTPTDADNTQLLQAIQNLPSGRLLGITSLAGYTVGTFTPNPLTKLIRVRMVAAGGGGGGIGATISGQVAIGQNAGAGSYCEALIFDPVACSFQVGFAGAPGGAAGPDGGDSWFGSHTALAGSPAAGSITCYGGKGGTGGTPASFSAAVVVGGAAGGALPALGSGVSPVTYNAGEPGTPAAALAAVVMGGAGGGTLLGPGGAWLQGTIAGQGGAGNSSGSGGSGALAGQSQAGGTGGAGQSGHIIVEQYTWPS